MSGVLYLASKSPRRRELLGQLGIAHVVLEVDVPEERAAGECPLDYVQRVARDKAEAGWLRVGQQPLARVLSADTEVVLDDEVFGKPVDALDAAAMLRRLSGRRHLAVSAVCLADANGLREELCETWVEFDPLSERDIAGYIDSGECFGKAGAYAIQGRAGAFIKRIEGSYSGVMGLPLFETARLLCWAESGVGSRESGVGACGSGVE
jgi:septum formation protein